MRSMWTVLSGGVLALSLAACVADVDDEHESLNEADYDLITDQGDPAGEPTEGGGEEQSTETSEGNQRPTGHGEVEIEKLKEPDPVPWHGAHSGRDNGDPNND